MTQNQGDGSPQTSTSLPSPLLNLWPRDRIKKFSRALSLKHRIKVLSILNCQGEKAAFTELNRIWKYVNREDTHTLISDGDIKPKHGSSVRVEELTKQGFSVGKIAKELGLSRRGVLAIRASLHKKQSIVPLCTTPTRTDGQPPPRSQPQVHDFQIEIMLPSHSQDWQRTIDKTKVNNFSENKEFRGGLIQDFQLDSQVSVRTTPKRLFLTVRDVWGKSIEECKELAWQLGERAAIKLEELFGFEFATDIQMRFRGAHWALVGHDVAKKAANAHLEFMTIINGKKRMWTDSSPGKSLEFVRQEDAKISYKDEEARVIRGLTNEYLGQVLQDFMQATKTFIEVQTQEVRSRTYIPERIGENLPDKIPEYIG